MTDQTQLSKKIKAKPKDIHEQNTNTKIIVKNLKSKIKSDNEKYKS